MKLHRIQLLAVLVVGTWAIAQHPSMPSAPRAFQEVQGLKPVRIQEMMRGYFYASSSGGPSALDHFGGWGGSSNASSKDTPQRARMGLEIIVDTTALVPFANGYQGRRVTVRNNGPDTLYFPAQDSRLFMKAQAQRRGAFADIEYLPSSWCGNSYHTLYLAPGEQWTFAMPRYDGPEPTRLRLELAYRTGPNDRQEQLAYSYSFPGAIHPKQFSHKPNYQRGGIMDPYND